MLIIFLRHFSFTPLIAIEISSSPADVSRFFWRRDVVISAISLMWADVGPADSHYFVDFSDIDTM